MRRVRLRVRIARFACALVLLQSLASPILNQIARSERAAGTIQIAICTPVGLRYVTLPGRAAPSEQTPGPAKADTPGPDCPICFGCHVALGLPQAGGDWLIAPVTSPGQPLPAAVPRPVGVSVLAFAARGPPAPLV